MKIESLISLLEKKIKNKKKMDEKFFIFNKMYQW